MNPTETQHFVLNNPVGAAELIERLERENKRLRYLLVDGIEVVELHTLYNEDGTVALRGSFRCVDDCEIDQWMLRVRESGFLEREVPR